MERTDAYKKLVVDVTGKNPDEFGGTLKGKIEALENRRGVMPDSIIKILGFAKNAGDRFASAAYTLSIGGEMPVNPQLAIPFSRDTTGLNAAKNGPNIQK